MPGRGTAPSVFVLLHPSCDHWCSPEPVRLLECGPQRAGSSRRGNPFPKLLWARTGFRASTQTNQRAGMELPGGQKWGPSPPSPRHTDMPRFFNEVEVPLEKSRGGKQPVACATVIKAIFPFLEYYVLTANKKK